MEEQAAHPSSPPLQSLHFTVWLTLNSRVPPLELLTSPTVGAPDYLSLSLSGLYLSFLLCEELGRSY